MRSLLPYLHRLKYRWVALANAVLLGVAQLYVWYLEKQPVDERTDMLIRILHTNNSSMLWYLLIGSGFYFYYRYRERQTGNTGRYLGSFWIPLSVWVLGMIITTAMTIKSLSMWW